MSRNLFDSLVSFRWEFPLSESATAEAIGSAMHSPGGEVKREGSAEKRLRAEPQPSTSGASADRVVSAGHPAGVEVTKPCQVFLSHCWSDFAEDDKRWVLLEIRNGLIARGLAVFLDSHSLEAGAPLYDRISDEVLE